MRTPLIILILVFLTLQSVGQSTPVKFKQIEKGSADGQVPKMSGGQWIFGKVNWSEIENVPPVGTGSVTSVGLEAPSIFTVSGSPVTTSGNLRFYLNNQSANTVFAGPPSGAPAVPTFRLLTINDIPDLDASKITTGTFSVNRIGTGTPGPNTYIDGATGEWTVLPNAGNITLTGPVTGTGTGTILTNITNKAVTYPKIQDVTGQRLLGNPNPTTGTVSEITLGTGIIFESGSLQMKVDLAGLGLIFTYVERTVVSGDIVGSNVTIPLGYTRNVNNSWQVLVNGVKIPWSVCSASGTNLVINNTALAYAIQAGDYVEVFFHR